MSKDKKEERETSQIGEIDWTMGRGTGGRTDFPMRKQTLAQIDRLLTETKSLRRIRKRAYETEEIHG